MSLPLGDLDLSELEGKKFTCDDRCGLCCICQPELLPHEVEWFTLKYPQRIIEKKRPYRRTMLAVKRGYGSCTFLNESRRCEIYNVRPYHCRQFPFHTHIGRRVRVELNLSCRGVWYGGTEDAMALGKQLVCNNLDIARNVISETREIYRDFEINCRDAGIYRSEEFLRKEMASKINFLSELSYLAQILNLSTEDEEMTLPSAPERSINTAELKRTAMDLGLQSLSAENISGAPVYCDPEWRWNLFVVKEESLRWNILNDDGTLDVAGDINPNDVKLLLPEDEGLEVFLSYIKTLNQRDSLMGYVNYLVDSYGYEDYISNTYFGVIATTALDLLWRASLIAHLQGGKLDHAGMIEGIISYDMDRLDAPTIGAFL